MTAARSVDAGAFTVDIRAIVAGRNVGYHDHGAASVVVPLRGRFIERTDAAAFDCRPGSVLVERPGEPHDNRDIAAGSFLCIELAPDFARYAGAGDARLVRSEPAHRIASGVEALLLDPAADPLEVQEGALQIFGQLLGPARRSHRPPRALRDMLCRAAAEPGAAANIPAFAREHDVHPVVATRAFRRQYGVSLARYVRFCRARRAHDLLRADDRPIGDIAAEVGFSDQSHMTRELRAIYGATPAVLRRRSECRIF